MAEQLPTGVRDAVRTSRPMLEVLKQRAKSLKCETHALYLASRDPRTPWYAKAIGFLVIGYAISPIDLIPDFIPVLGYLDDLILLPMGLLLFRSLVPADVIDDCRIAAKAAVGSPRSWGAAVVIVCLWVISVSLLVIAACAWYRGQRVRAG